MKIQFLPIILLACAGCASAPKVGKGSTPDSYLNYTVADEPARNFTTAASPMIMPGGTFLVMSKAEPQVIIQPPPEPMTIPMVYTGDISNACLQTSYDLKFWQETDLFAIATNNDGSADWVPYQIVNVDKQFFRIVGR